MKTKEAFPKLQFLGKLPLKKRVSQPANQRFVGEKPQEVFQNQPGFGKTSKLLAITVMLLAVSPVFSQSEFGLRLAPGAALPLGLENIGAGFGAAAGLDWAYALGARRQFLPGLSVDGSFTSLTVKAGSALTFMEAGIGPAFRWKLTGRFSLGASLNAGVSYISWNGENGTRLKFGGSVRGAFALSPYIGLFASAGYTRSLFPANLPQNTLGFGAGVSFNLSEMMNTQTRIRGEKIEQRPVFPVSYAWYQHNPAAVVRITNDEPNAITDVSLSFFMEQYMRSPTVFASLPRLGPEETAEVPVTALFNESMLNLLENTSANARVLIEYRSLGARKNAELPVQMPVYHRNAMSWDDDRRAASFVSARDPAAGCLSAERRRLRYALIRQRRWYLSPGAGICPGLSGRNRPPSTEGRFRVTCPPRLSVLILPRPLTRQQ